MHRPISSDVRTISRTYNNGLLIVEGTRITPERGCVKIKIRFTTTLYQSWEMDTPGSYQEIHLSEGPRYHKRCQDATDAIKRTDGPK